MIDNLMREIMCLAKRVEPDGEAVREWFFETPLSSHGQTARELMQLNRGDLVLAFLRRILRDTDRESEPSSQSHALRLVSVTIPHDVRR